jgi:hypothetical protein
LTTFDKSLTVNKLRPLSILGGKWTVSQLGGPVSIPGGGLQLQFHQTVGGSGIQEAMRERGFRPTCCPWLNVVPATEQGSGSVWFEDSCCNTTPDGSSVVGAETANMAAVMIITFLTYPCNCQSCADRLGQAEECFKRYNLSERPNKMAS